MLVDRKVGLPNFGETNLGDRFTTASQHMKNRVTPALAALAGRADGRLLSRPADGVSH